MIGEKYNLRVAPDHFSATRSPSRQINASRMARKANLLLKLTSWGHTRASEVVSFFSVGCRPLAVVVAMRSLMSASKRTADLSSTLNLY